MSIDAALLMNNKPCSCGRVHRVAIKKILLGKGVLTEIPTLLSKAGISRAFLIADKNTYRAAGERVEKLLMLAGIDALTYVYGDDPLLPDEKSVGKAVMHFTRDCDVIIGVGSGVINDIGKLTATIYGVPYMIVGTAPSMDGYASATVSMERDGLKLTLPAKTPEYIVGDSEILVKAPAKMLLAGVGDMIAKYVGICEWRIGKVVTGEYYCEEIAELMRSSLRVCLENASALLRRNEEAALVFFEALVTAGIAAAYAKSSRPASGVEHYFSHIFDMRGISFGTPTALHGLQCGVGTLTTLRLYEKLVTIMPNKEKALSYTESYDYEERENQLASLIGEGSKAMILKEKAEQKFSRENHSKRLAKILSGWGEIQKIIAEELPSSAEIRLLLTRLGAPTTASELGIDESLMPLIFKATKDVCNKYVLSHLAWDIGVLEELM